MAVPEAIEKEIAREKAELDGLAAEEERLWKALEAPEHARKAQALREQALRDQQAGKAAMAKKAQADAKKLSDEFDLELARIRGKREALRAEKRAIAAK